MADPKPPVRARLTWQHDLVFDAESGQARATIDSDGVEGLSPMQAVAFGFAGCMSVDLAHILARGRHALRALTVSVEGHRASTEPARYTRFDLHYVVKGDIPRDAIERAIQLSRDKYCSVWHSLRQDIELNVTYEVAAA
jgi:putative redox protein